MRDREQQGEPEFSPLLMCKPQELGHLERPCSLACMCV